jgi:hypothetical protein
MLEESSAANYQTWAILCSRTLQNGETHSVVHMYKTEDAETYGQFVPVVCGSGDVRLTMGSVIPGSTEGCDRVCRVVYPLLGVSDDNEGLEMSRWSLREDMVGLNAGPTGQKHRLGLGVGGLEGRLRCEG